MAREKLTKAQRALEWLRSYRDGNQNGQPYAVNSVFTRLKGSSHSGLKECQELGFIVSQPDAKLNSSGWRHDITDAGRQALAEEARDVEA